MKSLRSYLLESNFPAVFMRAVFSALPLMEACNINKDFLVREAGSPERFAEVKSRVQALWKQETMDAQLNQKAAQKVLNILYLMEIRSPGFTTAEKLHVIHDLGIHNLLDTKFLSKVNSDTTPERANEILSEAVQHQEQAAKVYSDLTPEQERIWNRVKVYHEFPDGFKWVYAVDDNGNILPSMPSSITAKTMHHCGNNYGGASKDDQYWELRGPDGKAYLTVILTPDGEIQESKSWGNAVNKYRTIIQPYVKWLLMDKVTGVTHRYNYGYAAYNNYGVKDFMADDPEFVDYVVENKPELIGSTEGKILFWRGALEDGIVTVDQLKSWYEQKMPMQYVMDLVKEMPAYHQNSKFGRYAEANPNNYAYGNQSIFGYNPFEVICAVCSGCPFSKEELTKLVNKGVLKLAEFANYDIKLLDDDMQAVFVQHDPTELNTLIQIANQVASFKVSPHLMDTLVENAENPPTIDKPIETSYCVSDYSSSEEMNRAIDENETRFEKRNRWVNSTLGVLRYMAEGNPPEKVQEFVDEHFEHVVDAMESMNILSEMNTSFVSNFIKHSVIYMVDTLLRFREVPLSDYAARIIRAYMTNVSYSENIMEKVLRIGRPKIDPIFTGATSREMIDMSQDRSSIKKVDARNIGATVNTIALAMLEYPDIEAHMKRMSPVYKLGVYCKLPEDRVPKEDAIKLAIKLMAVSENSHSVPSARVGVVCMALSRFPEIIDRVGEDAVLDYFQYNHAGEILSAGWLRNKFMTPALNERVINILSNFTDEQLSERLRGSFMTMIDALKIPGENFSDDEQALLRRVFYLAPGLFYGQYNYYIRRGAVDIPYDEWSRYADKMGKYYFVQYYLFPKYEYCAGSTESGLPDYVCKYVLDYIVELMNGDIDEKTKREGWTSADRLLRSIMNFPFMTRRMNKATIQDELRRELESGSRKVSMNTLKTMNGLGLITKDDLKKYMTFTVGDTDMVTSKSELEMYISNLGKYLENGALGKVMPALFEWIINMHNADSVICAGKIARWCTKNRAVPGLIDAIPTDMIDQVITMAVDVAADEKTVLDRKQAEYDKQDKLNEESRKYPELSYQWRWNTPVDWEPYKKLVSAIEALEIMRRRCSYQVDMFDKNTLK